MTLKMEFKRLRMKLSYVTVDVFTDTRFGGNQLSASYRTNN